MWWDGQGGGDSQVELDWGKADHHPHHVQPEGAKGASEFHLVGILDSCPGQPVAMDLHAKRWSWARKKSAPDKLWSERCWNEGRAGIMFHSYRPRENEGSQSMIF